VQEPTPIEHLRLDVPQKVAAIVHRLMAKDPADRFHTPAELTQALLPFAVSAPTAWADSRRSEPLFPSNPSFSGEDEFPDEPAHGPEFALHPSSWDETSALAGTVPPDLSATPLTAIRPASQSKTFATVLEEERRRLYKTLLWTAGVAGGLALLGALAFLFMHGQ
jgi:serine/threonine protein kinase